MLRALGAGGSSGEPPAALGRHSVLRMPKEDFQIGKNHRQTPPPSSFSSSPGHCPCFLLLLFGLYLPACLPPSFSLVLPDRKAAPGHMRDIPHPWPQKLRWTHSSMCVCVCFFFFCFVSPFCISNNFLGAFSIREGSPLPKKQGHW